MTGGKYKGVATTLGIVESSILEIENEKEFISLCRKRSVFTNQELSEHWNYNKANRPFVVNFLYTYSFRKRPNLEWLVNNGVISSYDNVPRGFSKITVEQFDKLLRYAY